ncbi:class I SAM-dependent methyltransferase [Streptomyces sp. SLBN-115]|uniref:class I SAM-dependent methyltransferase n=1 Tax=Streptomyces sp. SLBN-115 TaxID=2768453 RepID=UPI001F17F2F4|nr:class I SAM-dependent methyltransferase [Streptomyces sp. SLBN-115]
MLAEADKTLAGLPNTTIRLHNKPAAVFVPPYADWAADMVTICRAFHWMDQPAVLSLLDGCTAKDATVVVMGDGSLWTARSAWTDALRALIQECTGSERRAGKDKIYAVHDRPYREILAESAFTEVEEHTILVARHWTVQTVIGYLYSTSFASRPLFGNRLNEFEERARALLGEHTDAGVLIDHARFDLPIGRRP